MDDKDYIYFEYSKLYVLFYHEIICNTMERFNFSNLA